MEWGVETQDIVEIDKLWNDCQERASVAGEKHFWDSLKAELGYYPKNPNTGKDSRFTVPRQFNLMFKQHVGATGEGGQTGYLRAETCQPIFVDFDLVRTASRGKVPFGIAQVGRAFRNEINPRNFLFRAREFVQMELEFFVRPDVLCVQLREAGAEFEAGYDGAPDNLAPSMEWYDYWLAERLEFYRELRLPAEKFMSIRIRRRSWRTTRRRRATSTSNSRMGWASWKACTTAATTTSSSIRPTAAKASATSTTTLITRSSPTVCPRKRPRRRRLICLFASRPQSGWDGCSSPC
jgi:hypothetical protein